MSVLEAVNGKVWNYSDSAVAILPAELGALEKWVERTSSELLRAQERGEKQKSRGPEL